MKKALLYAIIALLSSQIQAQVTKLNSNQSLTAVYYLNSSKALLESDIDKTLWVTDGTTAGTFKLSSDIEYIEEGTTLNGKHIFIGSTTATGQELYITDGTVAGTHLIKDIFPGTEGSDPDQDFAVLNGFVYFTASRPSEGRELWRTDGTDAGTTLVKDIVSGSAGSNDADDYELFSTGTYLLFSARTASNGVELWKSDGTNAGTVVLKNINPNELSSDPGNFYKYNNVVLFLAKTEANGVELWKTDGTTNGTEMVKDINPGPGNSITVAIFHNFNGKIYFTASTPATGVELWSTDGTTGNTQILKDIEVGPLGSSPSLFSLIPFGNKLIFTATTLAQGAELWMTDGTTSGTQIFKDIVPGPVGSFPFILPPITFNVNDGTINYSLFKGTKFFLMVRTPEKGSELWISDGTAAGTDIVKDINPSANNGMISPTFAYTSEALFFTAGDFNTHQELYKSDGTTAGTGMVKEINNFGDADIFLTPFVINNKVIFSATDGDDEMFTDFYSVDGNFFSLPVNLAEFTVTSKNKDAQLYWLTLTELNTKDFTIERSFDGNKFYPIGKIQAAGNSTQKQTYSFIDKNVEELGNKVVYYRLLMTDKDGSSAKSKVISLRLTGGGQWNVKVMGNIVNSNVPVLLSGVSGKARLTVKDLSGKVVTGASMVNGSGNINIPVDNLASGVYFLVVETNNERKVVKFVKQ